MAEDRLELMAQEIAADWGLELGPRIPSKHSFIAPVGSSQILKIVRSDITEHDHEADALRLWNGDHAVRLLRHDSRRKALLLERAVPGRDLSSIEEADAMSVALDVGRALWISPPGDTPFRSVVQLSERWLDELWGQDEPLVARAQAKLEKVQIRRERLVHGDLHHHNIVEHHRGWVAIDAQPAVGEPEYDVVTLLWNPIGTTPSQERTDRWMRAFVDAGLDLARVRAWAIVRGTILSFSSETGRRHEAQLSVARSLL